MYNNPYVTVLIPYKTNVKYLFVALKSVFKQTYKNIKIIIIYDNSDKSDLLKIKKFIKIKKKNKIKIPIKIINNKKNLGAGFSRNIGLKNCNTKYVAFLDSDDLWLKDKLQIQINFMEKNNQVFSHTSYFQVNYLNKVISVRLAKSSIYYEDLIKSCDIGLSTVIVNLKFLKKNNFYFPKIRTKEDFILWIKIAKKIKLLRGLRQKLTYYRKTKNSLSSNKFVSVINGYEVYRHYLNFNLIKSVYYLFILSFNSFKKKL